MDLFRCSQMEWDNSSQCQTYTMRQKLAQMEI